jgi:oligopeptide/dipeptide ABC transporter ATP-binding protein
VRLLEIRNLRTFFYVEEGVVRAVDGVDLTIEGDRTVGLVGESGCGKSVTARSIMRLIPSPPGRIASGEILFARQQRTIDLVKLNPKGREMRAIRGREIAMIFQEPMTSLNPVLTIGLQITEAMMLHRKLRKKEARRAAVDLLHDVGMAVPEQRVREYPHQLSGGMRQRAMIAMALSCNPRLLIADEPTTALDMTIQAQVLELIKALRRERQAACLFITHDLGVVAGMANDIVVMYRGRVVERASVHELFRSPKHPYTQGLLNSIPSLAVRKGRLQPIQGVMPDAFDPAPGCGFEPRCPLAMRICALEPPHPEVVSSSHAVACWLHTEARDVPI